jgi:hypothetical protein
VDAAVAMAAALNVVEVGRGSRLDVHSEPMTDIAFPSFSLANRQTPAPLTPRSPATPVLAATSLRCTTPLRNARCKR